MRPEKQTLPPDEYMWKRRLDATSIINLNKAWEKIQLVSKAMVEATDHPEVLEIFQEDNDLMEKAGYVYMRPRSTTIPPTLNNQSFCEFQSAKLCSAHLEGYNIVYCEGVKGVYRKNLSDWLLQSALADKRKQERDSDSQQAKQ